MLIQDLGALVRGAGPAQVAVQVGEHDPRGVSVEQLLGRNDGLMEGGGQVLVGCRSVRLPMPLASIEGSIGMRAFFVRSPNWRTRSTGQAQWRPWIADQAQQPHEVVWVHRLPPDRRTGPVWPE